MAVESQQEPNKRTALALSELLGEPFDIFFLVEISRDGMGFTLAQRIELSDCLFACLCVAGRDVDCGAIGYVSFRDHSPDAFCSAGDQDNFALQDGSHVRRDPGEELGGRTDLDIEQVLNIHGRGYLCLKIAALYKPKKRFKNRANTARRGESPSATSASQTATE
jgi:hypothetical protein